MSRIIVSVRNFEKEYVKQIISTHLKTDNTGQFFKLCKVKVKNKNKEACLTFFVWTEKGC